MTVNELILLYLDEESARLALELGKLASTLNMLHREIRDTGRSRESLRKDGWRCGGYTITHMELMEEQFSVMSAYYEILAKRKRDTVKHIKRQKKSTDDYGFKVSK